MTSVTIVPAMARTRRKQHPMMPIWLKRIGAEVERQRKSRGEKQDAFASRIKVSRQQLGIIELGKRSYGIGPLVQVLSGLSKDPVKNLLTIGRDINSVDSETVEACRTLIEALTDARRRKLALGLIDALGDKDDTRNQ